MSRNDEEEGVIKLPSAAFAAVRKAAQKASEEERAAVLQQFTEAYELAPAPALKDEAAFRWWGHTQTLGFGLYAKPKWPLLNSHLGFTMLRGMRGTGGKLKKPRAAFLGPAPTNRTTTFCSEGGTLHFDPAQKTVEWSVDRNNRAVEDARSTPLFAAFQMALGQVRWTRGTGGVIYGTDEYHEDANKFGGQGGYVTGAYGPVGAEEEPSRFEPFTDSAGVRHSVGASPYAQRGMKQRAAEMLATSRALTAMARSQGRVARGVPTGGQFTGHGRPESGVRLG